MRWLARRILHCELLELEDGTALYYLNRCTGPGYVLDSAGRRILEGHIALAAWVLVGFWGTLLGPPNDFLEAWLAELTGNSFIAWLLDMGVLVCILGSTVWLVRTRKERFLQRYDTRNPTLWDHDLKRLATNSVLRTPPGFLLYFTALVAMAWGLGLVLDIALMMVTGNWFPDVLG